MADKKSACGCGCALKQEQPKGAQDNQEAKKEKEGK